MKAFKHYFKALWVFIFAYLATGVQAQIMTPQPTTGQLMTPDALNAPASQMLPRMDSVDVSLITCGPGTEVYSLYGHTALRVTDRTTGEDMIVNWGIFDTRKSYFVIRFIFGLTDYQIAVEPFNEFFIQYAATGRWMKQQTLNLSRKEKWDIIRAINRNNLPQNRVYRYNYFYDNCTTRARDMIESHIDGKIEYGKSNKITCSYREMTHQWNEQSRWARFGNDMLLGLKADCKTDFRQQQFLPDSLRADFDNAVVIGPGGIQHPLVEQSTMLFDPTLSQTQDFGQAASASFPLSPIQCSLLLLGITLIICLLELKFGHQLWGYDAILLTVDSAAAIILLAMVFSQHPTVSLNLQILLCNPLTIIFMWPALAREKHGESHFYWKALLICILLFYIGNTVQHYAEGMNIVASCFLLRALANLRIGSQNKVKKV